MHLFILCLSSKMSWNVLIFCKIVLVIAILRFLSMSGWIWSAMIVPKYKNSWTLSIGISLSWSLVPGCGLGDRLRIWFYSHLFRCPFLLKLREYYQSYSEDLRSCLMELLYHPHILEHWKFLQLYLFHMVSLELFSVIGDRMQTCLTPRCVDISMLILFPSFTFAVWVQ